MKTHSRLLRGYNNNIQPEDLSIPSPSAINSEQNKCRESTFSTPSLYMLPRVYSHYSHKEINIPSPSAINSEQNKCRESTFSTPSSYTLPYVHKRAKKR